MAGTLYIVATPIGNLEDITQRALRILREVDLIACEDTRRSRKLLNHFGISKKTVSYHEHNEHERAEQLCKLLESGQNVALISDAGTPLISDPGYQLVQAAIEHHIVVVPIPGAAAFVTALSASGMPTDEFFFGGFLPSRATARRRKFEHVREVAATLIFYEAPHRIAKALQDALDIFGDREAVIARELTKLHEEFARGKLSNLARRFSERGSALGEFVLIISGAKRRAPQITSSPPAAELIDHVLTLERKGLSSKEALKAAARELGIKRAEAYRLLVAQKNRRKR